MTRIPDEFVEELRRRIDIVDVVSEHVQLRRSGRSFTGLCPFHNEKSPSFSVSTERQMFHCFGCGASGTVIRFVMDIEGLTFLESVTKLATRASLELPIALSSQNVDEHTISRTGRMKDAHELAAKFYNYILMNTAAGVQALTYLESRGISRQTIALFRLGVSSDSPNALTSLLIRRGFEESILIDGGLSVQLGNQLVDRFRGRVMIPICDGQGQVVAFGGRTLSPDGKPKYLNSPETPIFHKSMMVFNLHQSRKAMRKNKVGILMEGYMDVISVWQAGVENAVATLGTSLTQEQVEMMKRYVERVIIAYDGDNAGIRAAERALSICEQAGLEVRIAEFPDGLDPDEYVRSHGGPAFERLTKNGALSGTQFLLKQAKRKAELQSVAGRTDYLRRALELLGSRASPIEQDTELRLLAQEFDVSVDALKDELFSMTKHNQRRSSNQEHRERLRHHTDVKKLPSGAVTASKRVLQLALTDDNAYKYIYDEGIDELALPEQTALLARYYGYRAEFPEGGSLTFLDTLDDPDLSRVASSILLEEYPEFDQSVLEDYLKTIQLHHLETEYKQGLEHLVLAQLDQNYDKVKVLRLQVEALQQKIAQLKMPQAKD